MRLLSLPTLPLLSKELIEQSNRRRTFVLRTVYALVFYAAMLWTLWEQVGWNSNSLAVLGRGWQLFMSLVSLQFLAIYAFLPGLTCGVLTAEKERDTIAMLLLTKLGPWTILIEKLLSRLMPMSLLLLLSLPLLAVAYSLGGVESVQIIEAVVILFLTMVQVGSLALFCSAWFRTTAGAFVGTYVLGGLLLALPTLVLFLWYSFLTMLGIPVYGMGELEQSMSFSFLGPTIFEGSSTFELSPVGAGNPFQAPAATVLPENASFFTWAGLGTRLMFAVLFALQLGYGTWPLWLSALVFLFAARCVLWRRAFVQPKQRILQFFRWLDAWFHRMNQNQVTKGIVLIQEAVTLPTFDPIAWRETKKKTLGTTRYLIRFLLVIEPPVVFLLLLADISSAGSLGGNAPGNVTNDLLWIITVMSITVLATGLIAGERSKQTLDVLLATPLTIPEIIGQKLAAVRKLTRVLWIPLFTVVCFDLWWWFQVRHHGNSLDRQGGWVWFLIQRLLPMFIYPPLIAWIAFHFGLRLRNQGQAMLATIGLIVAWCLIPALLYGVADTPRRFGEYFFGQGSWMVLSPAIYVDSSLRRDIWEHLDYNEWAGHILRLQEPDFRLLPKRFDQQWAYAVHFGMCIASWLLLRWRGYRGFARAVKRNEGEDRTANPAIHP